MSKTLSGEHIVLPDTSNSVCFSIWLFWVVFDQNHVFRDINTSQCDTLWLWWTWSLLYLVLKSKTIIIFLGFSIYSRLDYRFLSKSVWMCVQLLQRAVIVIYVTNFRTLHLITNTLFFPIVILNSVNQILWKSNLQSNIQWKF